MTTDRIARAAVGRTLRAFVVAGTLAARDIAAMLSCSGSAIAAQRLWRG
jgi:hypothetical protein